jgi:hypothetical protein
MTPDPPTTGVDGPPPAVDVPPRGGVLGFLNSVPGILTGVGAVITALGTVYGIHLAGGPPASTLDEPSGSPPSAQTPVDTTSVAAQADTAPVADDALGDEVTALMTECANGSAGSCATLLDLLVDNCYYGYAVDCDVLYYITPPGSDYEAYGATCGNRFGWEYAGRCSEL